MREVPILYVLHEKEKYVEGRLRDGDCFLIDLEDFEKVSRYRWHKTTGYMKNTHKNCMMHRYILGLVGNKEARYKIEVDHINRNRLDNRKCNLRIISKQDNMKNKSTYTNNKSGIPGVKWNKNNNKWQVQINHNKKRIHLGMFDDLEKAKEAREKAEKKYFKIKGEK